MLQLNYEKMMLDTFSNRKGYLIGQRTFFITNSEKQTVTQSKEKSITVPTVFGDKVLNLIVAKTEQSSEYTFFVYAKNSNSAIEEIKQFMCDFNIADNTSVENIKIVSALIFGGK